MLGVIGWIWAAHTDDPIAAPDKTGPTDPAGANAPGMPLATGQAPKVEAVPLNEWMSPFRHFPQADTLIHENRSYTMDYALDSATQSRAEYWLKRFRPEMGVVLISDLHTPSILAAAENHADTLLEGLHLALGGQYPAASLIKIITASAGLENTLKGPEDSLPRLGANHTLYRSQIRLDHNPSYPMVALREAFARSINPAFAILGIKVGPKGLQNMAEQFGFNRERPCALWGMSQFTAPDSGFSLAETACGFTDRSTISPLHALQIARAIGSDGRLLTPVFATSLTDQKTGLKVPISPVQNLAKVVDDATLLGLQDLMEATTRIGTARKGFHRAMRANDLNLLKVGGKTGSLDGNDPPGRYEWFIGYANYTRNPAKGIAISVMLIHHEYLAVHASELAAYIIRDWLRHQVRLERTALSDTI